jgi:hypothetical protein
MRGAPFGQQAKKHLGRHKDIFWMTLHRSRRNCGNR